MIPILKSLRIKILTPLFSYVLEPWKDASGTNITDSEGNNIEIYKRVNND